MISYKEFKNLMEEFSNTTTHHNSCIAYSEGQLCCIENEYVLNYIYSLFEERGTVPPTSRIKCCGE